ncbi:hypothetical protein Tco_0498998 [Tanacetum coccineum]
MYVKVMSKEFHNSIMKDKMVYKGNNVIGALMHVPIFVGTFSIVTDFAALENMNDYRDKGMGDVSPYGVFQFVDTAYWSPVQFIDLAGKEINEVGEVSII